MIWKRSLLVLVLLVAAGLASWFFGPRVYRQALINSWVHYNKYDIRRDGNLRVGDPAPDVELLKVSGDTTRLSAHWSEKPLVLIFGSYT